MEDLPDHILIKVITSIDSSMSRPRYEELLVELELYDFDLIRGVEEYYGLSKRDLMIKTFKENDQSLILEALRERRAINKEAKIALASIGFELGESLAGELADPVEEHSRLERNLRELGLEDVQRFLDQSMENYINENYEASNAIARTSLEHLVEQIAGKISSIRKEEIPKRGRFRSPVDYRNYLFSTHFLDESEKQFLDKFYGYASTDGSHPGISTESESRLRRFMVVGIALLYIEKLNNYEFMSGLS